MYIPQQFKNENREEILKFIEENSFGILITKGQSRIIASHIPLHLSTNKDGNEILSGHLSKANEGWASFENNEEVLVIFPGQHTYISPSWYSHENVPTWNYIAVHVYGSIRIIEGEELLDSLKKLVNKYEKGSINPVTVEKMNPELVNREMKGIVGFEILINDLQAAYKLSQNRSEKDYDNIIDELSKNRSDPNSVGIAEEMRRIKNDK